VRFHFSNSFDISKMFTVEFLQKNLHQKRKIA